MRTDHIIIPLIEKKIIDPLQIFINENIFDELLFWCRESNRERLLKHSTQQGLANKIDDVGIEVDKYLKKVRLKMLNNGQKGKNSLFYKLKSTSLTFKWLIQRWGNVFINISTNKNYKSFIDTQSIFYELDDNFGHSRDALTIILEEEEKIVWEKKKYIDKNKWHKDLKLVLQS